MWNALSTRLEALLPDSFRGRDDERSQRARRLLWMVALAALLQLVAATISTLVRGPNHLAGLLLLGTVASAVTPLVLHVSSTRVLPAAVWFLTVSVSSLSAVAWLGYGPLSPAVQALVLFPVVGVVLGGARLAVPFTIVSVAQIGLLLSAELLGARFPMEAHGDTFTLIHTLVTMSVLSVVTGFLALYERAWRRAQDEVKAANTAKSAFLAHMSHELRTPLTAIIGYTELLMDEVDPQTERDLERIQDAGSHLLSLVDQLLDLAKIEAGRLELSPEEVDVTELTERVLDEMRPMADRKHTRLIGDISHKLSTRADPTRLRQILLNLVSNACKFCEEGTITVRAHRTDGRVHIEVEDTGIGMNPEELSRVFEAFEQGEAGKARGTGLGLPISRHLAEAMGGNLTVTSEPGVGSCFRVVLP